MKSEPENAKLKETEPGVAPLYTADFLAEVNNKSSAIFEKNDYVNEFFLYFLIPFYERARQLKNQDEIGLTSQGCIGDYFKAGFRVIYLFSVVMLYLIAMPLYVLFKFRAKEKGQNQVQNFALIRSPASYSKMAFLKKEGVVFYTDVLVYQSTEVNLNLYAQPFFTRLTGVFVIAWLGIKDFFTLFLMAQRHLGFISAVNVLNYYRKRLAHKVTFEFYLSRLLRNVKPDVFYTGNKEDRFALIEKRLCNEQDIKTVCIPHGLEYAFKMPAGLVGDVFYCNSQYAKVYLEKLYSPNKTEFFFDMDIASQMFSRHVEAKNEKKIVFFPESREPEKNLLIIQFLKDQKLDFSVKLHGKDSLDHYRPVIDESVLVYDFDLAISNSICLARKSTVLLEAIYNHSIPIAVLVDAKDKSYFDIMFPSLKDDSILKVYSFDELKSLVEKLRARNV